MDDALVVASLAAVALMATAVVLTRDPARQAIVLSGFGIALGVLFVVFQAPDVAMSQIGVGTVIVPLLVVLALRAARAARGGGQDGGDQGDGDGGEGEGGGTGARDGPAAGEAR
ncbi:Na(+)/H(+) antiporter subunit B [Actinomadura yumaensis]|uniref:Na(+)/H(+) antiporter subunit B n=2 Tax=Actinomadura TaxID=1988 RepID=A0ABW2CZC7_9ACTN